MTPEEKAAAEAAAAAAGDGEKITLTQDEFNQKVQNRLNRQKETLEKTFNEKYTALETTFNDLKTQLETLTANKPADGNGKGEGDEEATEREKALRQQFKAQLEAEAAKAKAFENKYKSAEQTTATLQSQLSETKKRQAIGEAMNGKGFHTPTDIFKLTADQIEYDEASKSYVVKENGVVKENRDLNPMTLDEFFSEYATKNPWHVNSDAKGGAGSTHSNAGQKVIARKSDFKTLQEKSDWIDKNGPEAYQALPV